MALLWVAAALAGAAGLYASRFPMINDVTTTAQPAPEFVFCAALPDNRGRDLAYRKELWPVQRRAYPGVAALSLAVAPEEAFRRVREAAARMPGWTVAGEDPGRGRLEAVARTPLLRFADDVVILALPAPGGSVVHMRSKSRVGKGDLGANARRIRAFLAAVARGGR